MSDMAFDLAIHAILRKLTFNPAASDGMWWLHRCQRLLERSTRTLP